MKKNLFTITCFLLGLLSFTTQAQIISVTSGTDFNIVATTVISADSMDLVPAADFTINGSSLVRNNVVNNSTSISHLNKVYQFSSTTNPFNGSLKMFYNNTDLNGLSESCLKFLIYNGSSWSLDNSSNTNTTDNFILNSSVSSAFKEISGGLSFPDVSVSASGATTFTYGNSVTLSAPAIGNALTFNGSSNYVTVPSTINTAITGNNITVEGWFYITATFNLTGMVTEALGVDNNVKFGITSGLVSGAQKIYAGFTNAGSSTTVTSATNLPLNTWTHIAATYDGSSLNVYVNGTLSGTVANSSGLPSGADAWYFGKAVSGSNLFPGNMDEIRIWNVARSQSDINTYKNTTIANGSAGLVGYYKLDETSGITAGDATGNGYTGTVN